jgi:hypothetical protein
MEKTKINEKENGATQDEVGNSKQERRGILLENLYNIRWLLIDS